jgi:hypothetical protein
MMAHGSYGAFIHDVLLVAECGVRNLGQWSMSRGRVYA